MANENITRVTADATGYVAELDRATRSATAFAESNEAASARVTAAQAAVVEAVANGSDASTRSINSFISSLARQSDAAGKSTTELLRQRAAVLGVTDAAEPFIAHMESVAESTRAAADAAKAKSAADRAAAQAQAAASAEAERAIADTKKFVDAINAEAAAIGKTRAELLTLQAAQRGVTGDVSAAIAKIQAHADETAKASHNTHDFSLESAGARRELLVLGHELSQGQIKNFAGSVLVLAERSNAMGLIFNKTTAIIAGFTAVMGISAEITIKTAERLAEYATSVNTISKATGLSTDSIQSFGFAASTVGVNMKDASGALNSLTKSQNEATHGNKDALAAYKALGISLSDLKTASPADLLRKVEDAFSSTADGAGKAAVASELFGSNAEALIPLLDQGSKGADELNAAFVASGGALSGDTIRALAEFEERLKTSQAAMSNMNRTASLALLPTIINLTEALGDNAALKTVLVDFYSSVAVVVKSLATTIATLVIGFEQVSEVIATAVTVAAYGLTGQFKMAADSAKAGYANLKAEGNGYADFVEKLWAKTNAAGSSIDFGSGGSAWGDKKISYAKGQNSAPKTNENALNAQIADLKEQLAARETLMRDSVEHIKSLQQQGVINAMTAIEQEHDARAAAYTDELKIADQEIVLAGRKKQGAALVEWQNKKKAIQAEIVKNDRDTTDAIAVLQAKELAATKAYTDGLNTALQARAEAIAAQNQGKTLGATDADALERATAAAKEYAEKYQALAKSLTENKISTTQYDDEISALQAYERKRLALEAQATEQIRALNADGYAGAQKALADYAEAAQNKFNQVGTLVSDVAKNMEDALVTFAATGKLSVSSLATGVIADLARIGVKALELQAIQGVGSLLGNLFGGTGTSLTSVLGLSGSTGSDVASSTSSIYSGTNSFNFTGSFADGGAIIGPGTGTSDSILARVSNGEGILTADAMKRFGVANLDALNNGASINNLAKFATGGVVGSVAPSTSTGGDIHISAPVSVEGGADSTANAAGAADLQKKIAAAVRAVVSNERKQGGALWKMKNGIA